MKDSMNENIKADIDENSTKTEKNDHEDTEQVNTNSTVKSEDVSESVKQECDVTIIKGDDMATVKEENYVENETQNTPTEDIKTENNIENNVQKTQNCESEVLVKVGKAKRKRKRPLIRNRAKKLKLQQKSIEGTVDAKDTVNSTAEDVEYCLTVNNLPNNWSFMDIKNYIDTQCGPVDEIELLTDDKKNKGAIRLSYQTEQECKEAMKKLNDKEIDGTKLVLEMSVLSLEDEMPETPPEPSPPTVAPAVAPAVTPEHKEEPKPVKPWQPDLDAWELDPEGLYGLKPSFLAELNITPPLDKWVQVSNFRCDKLELKDILRMAGTIHTYATFNVTPKYAIAMYSHPLEAVQAVSMFNGIVFQGRALKVKMTQCPADTVILPRGLSKIGPGLGANGKPLRNITKHYHRFLTNRSFSINQNAFEIPEHIETSQEPVTFTVKSAFDFKYVIDASMSTVTTTNTTTTTTVASTGNTTVATPSETSPKPTVNSTSKVQSQQTPVKSPKPSPLLTGHRNNFGARPNPGWNGPGPMRPGPMGPMHRPMGPMHGPMGPRPGPMGPRPGPMGPMQGPMRPMHGPMQGPMPGPMQGPMQGPMPGPMQVPMQGPMPGPMQGPMHGPMQGQMQGPMQGHMQGPMQGHTQGPMPGPMQGQMQGQNQGIMPGPMQGTMPGPMQGTMPGPMQGTMPGPMQGSMPGPMQGQMQGQVGSWNTDNEPVQLKLSNMPPSTTYHLLCGKMAECGQVVSIQLTTPGCAVVTFANRMQADRCFQMYNGKLIDGHVMQVRYS